MDQITITRKDFRDKVKKLVVEQLKRAREDPDMGAGECIAMTVLHASICAALEHSLFGEETEED